MKLVKTIGHYLRVTKACIRMAALTIVEYPSSIIGWLISNPIQFVVGFATIQFVVQRFGEINGWNYGQLAVLYGLSVISHALSMIFFVQGWFMGHYVIEGLCRQCGIFTGRCCFFRQGAGYSRADFV